MLDKESNEKKIVNQSTVNALVRKGKFSTVFKDLTVKKVTGFRVPHGLLTQPLNSKLMWLLLLNLGGALAEKIQNPTYFMQNGTRYILDTYGHPSGPDTYPQVAWDFFETLAQNILEGEYGNVTVTQGAPYQNTVLRGWQICGYLVQLIIGTFDPHQRDFESKLIEASDLLLPEYGEKCREIDDNETKRILIGVGSFFGAVCLAWMLMCLTCYLRNHCCNKPATKISNKPTNDEENEHFVTDVDLEKDSTVSYQNSVPLKLSRVI